MTAFDGRGDEISVYFDNSDNEISIGIVDEESGEGANTTINSKEVPIVISDLLDAYSHHGESPVTLLAQLIRERNIPIGDVVVAWAEPGESVIVAPAAPVTGEPKYVAGA